jgi:hypothetical protein
MGENPPTPLRNTSDIGLSLAGTGSSAILLAVEQRIGPTVTPTPAAGVDPAFVPGLLPPPSAEPDAAAAAEEIQDVQDARQVPDVDDAAPEREAAAHDAEEEADLADEEDEEDGKPVFEVADRRASITADRDGVVFRLDGEEADFGWDEIQAVEIDTPRFGRRFSVTVYTSTRRWFQCDVEAPSRADLKTWTAELDAVLDARFEEGDDPKDAESPEELDEAEKPEAAQDADADAPTTSATKTKA